MTIEDAFLETIRLIEGVDKRLQDLERWVQDGSMRSSIVRPHTISGDAISPAHHQYMKLTPEAGNTDDLSTINDGRSGRQVAIRTADAAHTITVKDGLGNIDLCGSDIVLDCEEKVLILTYDGDLDAWIRYGMDVASSFLTLPDTPASYSGQTLKHVRVNVGETALEFVAHTTPSVINFGSLELLTISSGSVARTATSSFYNIAPETGIADNLDTITGGSDGDVIILRSASTSTITVTQAGNIVVIGTTETLDNSADKVTLIYDASLVKWTQVAQANNT